MAERVYPASKPPPSSVAQKLNGGTAINTLPQFPATKSQLYGSARPTYRPQPPTPRRRRRSFCCSYCLWLTLFVVTLLFLAAIAGLIFWVMYRPQRPRFTVTAIKISQFNITSSSQLDFKSNLTLAAYNPNGKIQFLYDPMTLSVDSNGVDVGDGEFPAFVHVSKNVTVLKAAILSSGRGLDDGSVSSLKSELKRKKGLTLTVQLDTKFRVKIGRMKTKKVKIRVFCDGIRATGPTGKSATTAITSGAKCKVDLRVKIWKWTF